LCGCGVEHGGVCGDDRYLVTVSGIWQDVLEALPADERTLFHRVHENAVDLVVNHIQVGGLYGYLQHATLHSILMEVALTTREKREQLQVRRHAVRVLLCVLCVCMCV
jgi:hypothetical protein